MIRLYLAAGAVAVIIAGAGFIYWQGGKENRLKRQIEHERTLERIEDATTDDRDADTILDRLRDLAK